MSNNQRNGDQSLAAAAAVTPQEVQESFNPNLTVPVMPQKPVNLDQSTRHHGEGKHGDQGEIRIKFTDSAKALATENI